MKLSTRDQVLVSLAVMLLLSLLMTFTGYMAGRQTRENAATLASDGVSVSGRITNKVERFGGVVNGPKYTWWLDVSYATKEGESHTKTIGVDQATYNRTTVGPVAVKYVGTNPDLFYIDGVYDGANQTDADASVADGISFYAAIASVAFGLGLVGMLLTRAGGGAPAPRGPNASTRGSRPLSGRSPGQFGARRAQ